jgi:hypothetical protein
LNKSITLVTAALDLGRADRNFEKHYLSSLKQLIQCDYQILVYADPRYWDELLAVNPRIMLHSISLWDLELYQHYLTIKQITSDPDWYQQAAWLENSITRSAHYITLTLMKIFMLKSAQILVPAERYVWADAGMFSSYGITDHISDFDFLRIPHDKFFITSYPYCTSTEIHGFNIQKLEHLAGVPHHYVSRATVFSASAADLDAVIPRYNEVIKQALSAGAIGTEEAIFTILCLKYPDLFTRFAMNSGDISEFLNTLK